MNSLLAHVDHVIGAAGGSPLYQIGADHLAGVIALLVLPIGALVLRRRGTPDLTPIQWLLAAIPITLIAILFLPEPAGKTLEEMSGA